MSNDWLYNHTYAVAKSKIQTNEKATFAVKLCPECNRVYEMTNNQYRKTVDAAFYDDFPRRGLHKQLCITCK